MSGASAASSQPCLLHRRGGTPTSHTKGSLRALTCCLYQAVPAVSLLVGRSLSHIHAYPWGRARPHVCAISWEHTISISGQWVGCVASSFVLECTSCLPSRFWNITGEVRRDAVSVPSKGLQIAAEKRGNLVTGMTMLGARSGPSMPNLKTVSIDVLRPGPIHRSAPPRTLANTFGLPPPIE